MSVLWRVPGREGVGKVEGVVGVRSSDHEGKRVGRPVILGSMVEGRWRGC